MSCVIYSLVYMGGVPRREENRVLVLVYSSLAHVSFDKPYLSRSTFFSPSLQIKRVRLVDQKQNDALFSQSFGKCQEGNIFVGWWILFLHGPWSRLTRPPGT